MSRLVSRNNVLRLVLVLFVASFITAIYATSSSRLGGRVPVVLAEAGGVVDVQIDDGSGSLVFTPAECQTQIASLSQCTTTLEVVNAGGTDSAEFEYSIDVWADTNGVDNGDMGYHDDDFSACYNVTLVKGGTPNMTATKPHVGPLFGDSLQLGQSKEWSLALAVKGDNSCQGATTTVIVAVLASDVPGFFDDIKPVPTLVPSPSVVAVAESPTVTEETPGPAYEIEDDEQAQAPVETVTETATPEPTSTATPRPATPTLVPATAVVPVATATPSPTPSPTAEVSKKPGREDGPNFLTQEIPSPSAISTNVKVVATNFTLSLLALCVILVATTVFNSTLEENAIEIGVVMNRLTGPTTRVGKVLGWIDLDDEDDDRPGWLASLLKPLGIVAITALIYTALEPDFGFNNETLTLTVALMAGIAMSTFLYEGGQVFWSSKRYRTPAAMRVYPMAIVIAVVSVLMTKFVSLHPGVIFGFVTAATIFPRGAMSPKEKGMIVLVPLVGLLATSIIAFLLIEPLRAYSVEHPGVWNALPETVAIALFVGGAQSALLILIPVTFNDGEKIWEWNKLVWFAIALPASFLFFHVMINSGGDYGDIVDNGKALTLLITAFTFLGVAGLTWLYFRIRFGPGEN